ncbi:unnamed protein product [Rotaria sordida]|uniref:Uncharacterized protein n=1 Tax=Rotaria sordida TaxID=392033 RepID=A0A814N2Z3_9BILA|nr:unnamed protein product [Rotaria sordida]
MTHRLSQFKSLRLQYCPWGRGNGKSKKRNDEQETESNLINSPSSSFSSELQNSPSTSSSSDDQITSDLVLVTSSSSLKASVSLNESVRTKSVPNDISASCNDPPVQPVLKNYPINHQKRSFQSICSIFDTQVMGQHSLGFKMDSYRRYYQEYPAIIKALDDISEEDSDTRSTNADPSLDYICGEHLILSIIQQITDLRNEQTFSEIYDKANEFCNVNHVDLVQQYRSRRKTVVPARFQECLIDSTLGQREMLSTLTDFMSRIYFPLIDCMLTELNDRFSLKTLSLMKNISTVYPENENFLNIDATDDFSRHIDGDSSELKSELNIIKSMHMPQPLNDIIQFLNELLPMSTAFP